MAEQLVETWQIHDRINRYLLDAIPDSALSNVSASKGRSVGEQFAHMHDVRLMWLKSAAPELLAGLEKYPKEDAGDKAKLKEALTRSGAAVAALLQKAPRAVGSRASSPIPRLFWATSFRTNRTTAGTSV